MLTDGELQAYVDGELTDSESARIEAILTTDPDGSRRLDGIRVDSATFSHALSALVEPVASRRAPPPFDESRRSAAAMPFGWASLARAAVLLLAVAGVASAVIPGTPLHEWVVSLRGDPSPTAVDPLLPATTPATVETVPAAEGVDPTGVTVRPDQGAVSIQIPSIPQGRTLRLVARLTEEPEARVSASGDVTPAYAVAPGAITVRGDLPETLVVGIPHWVERASIAVGEVVVVRKRGDRLVVAADARTLKDVLAIDVQR